jgi:transcription elongation factor GreA
MSTTTIVSATKAHPSRPMLTLDGRALLQDRAARLREDRIPALRAAVMDSRHDGSARQDLDRALVELDTLETTLDVAGVVSVAKSDESTVEPGDLAIVEFPGSNGRRTRVERFRLVHPIEAPLDSQRISVESPLARALIGTRVGQTVAVDAPARRYRVRVLAAVRPNLPPGSRVRAS